MPSFTVITGPVFSAKTNTFIELVDAFTKQGLEVLVVKAGPAYSLLSSKVVSHDGRVLPSLSVEEVDDLVTTLEEHPSTQVLAIDGVHYYSWDFLDIYEKAMEQGIDVIVTGTDLDFKGQPFGIMPHLLCYATHIKKLSAPCKKCGNPAHRSQRMVYGEPAKLSDDLYVEGEGVTYEPRCVRHHEIR